MNTSGETLDANAIPVPKADADEAFNAATCIGWGVRGHVQERVCDAVCADQGEPVALLPQGQPERKRRVTRMVEQMDKEGFGNCTNRGMRRCPKGIDLTNIVVERDFLNASGRRVILVAQQNNGSKYP